MEAEIYSYCSNGRRILFSPRTNVEDERKTEEATLTGKENSHAVKMLLMKEGPSCSSLQGSDSWLPRKQKETEERDSPDYLVLVGDSMFKRTPEHSSWKVSRFSRANDSAGYFRSLIGGRETFVVVMCARTYIRRDFQVQWRYN
jgi:hypothetical protein